MIRHATQQAPNFTFLLISLISGLAFIAITAQLGNPIATQLSQVFISSLLFIGVWSVRRFNRWFGWGMALIVVSCLIAAVGQWLVNEYSDRMFVGMLLLFFVLSTLLSIARTLFTGRVDGNIIMGSICAYLLIGWSFAMAYLLAYLIDPAVFNGVAGDNWGAALADVLYYSFVTLSTIGYGEITPVSPVVRFLAYSEAIIGQFYMAILVASLVGAHMSQRQSN